MLALKNPGIDNTYISGLLNCESAIVDIDAAKKIVMYLSSAIEKYCDA